MSPPSHTISLRHDRNVGDLVIDLHQQGYLHLDGRFVPGKLEGFIAHVRDTMQRTDVTNPETCKIWVAEINHVPVGCCALIIHPEQRGQIRWVVVTDKARGLGLGKTLVHKAVDYARKNGLKHLHLETIDHLHAAMGIYEALGFKITARHETDFWYGKDDMLIMECALKP